MKCQHCGAECSDHAKFCEQCGEKLINLCSNCGTVCSENAKFCENCGAALAEKVKDEDDGWIDKGKQVITTTGIIEGKTRRYKKGKGKPLPKKTIIILVIIFAVGTIGIFTPYFLGGNTQRTLGGAEINGGGYTSVLNAYTKAIKDTNFDAENYNTLATSVLNYYHQYGDFDFYYATADLDGNGTEELVIAMKPKEQDAYTLIDLYTSDASQTPRKAIDNTTFGDRSTLRILGDGTIIETASNGADDSDIRYYRIGQDGFTLEKAQGSKVADKQDFEWTKLF